MTTPEICIEKAELHPPTPPGYCGPPLREWQQLAVTQWHARRGLLAVAGVGSGKSLVGAIVSMTGLRTVVVLPAAALKQTQQMYSGYGARPTFVTYTKLTRADAANLLEELSPDVLILDEAHRVKNLLSNSAAKRIQRYLVANPSVRVCVLSASAITDRVVDFGHLAWWALRGAVRGLVPPTRAGLEMLEARLDADPAARAQFVARLMAVPGVVDQTADAAYGGRVAVFVTRRAPVRVLPDTWELPDGWMLGSAAEAASSSKCLAWGFWLQTCPRPSEAFMQARRAWAATVRRVIATGAADTESQVRELRPAAWAEYDAAARRDGERTRWIQPVWEEPLALAVPPDRHVIVWAEHQALQDAAAAALQCPLHREGGLDSDGVRLDQTRAPVVVASIAACHQALNAQHFNYNLVLEPPSDPEVWAQLIGRTARQGQTAPRVDVEIVIACPASENALRTAIQRAKVSGKRNPLTGLCLD